MNDVARGLLVWGGLAAIASAQGAPAVPADANAPAPKRWACCSEMSALPAGDPSLGPIAMPGSAPGWQAFHVYTSEACQLDGVGAAPVSDAFGAPQVVVLDDHGRCVLLQPGSGRYAAQVVVDDDQPCSAWACGDLDPAGDGRELYVGSRGGSLYRVRYRHESGYVTDRLGAVPEASFTVLRIADFDARRPGAEMLAFTSGGAVYEVRPQQDGSAQLSIDRIGDLGSRAEDAVVLPAVAGRPARVAVALQSGEVAVLRCVGDGIELRSVAKESASVLRIARRPVPASTTAPYDEIVYVARGDGLILRFVERDDGTWTRTPIYAGPLGPRGLAAGRFDADPQTETVAVFGESKQVQVLSWRPGQPWQVDTVYTDPGGGNALAAAELDGRNDTDELIGGGFGHHVFVLGREPGYGLAGVPTDPGGGDSALAAAASSVAPAMAKSPWDADGETLFEDGFESANVGEVPDGWQAGETKTTGTPATWSVERVADAFGGQQVMSVRAANANHTFNLLLTERTFPADLRLSVRIKPQSGREDQGGGMMWRAKDADDYYVVRWNPLENNLRVYKVEAGKRSFLENAEILTDPSRWHRIDVEMHGQTIAVGFDGKQVLTIEDGTFTSGGKVGLWTKADASSWFDAFAVSALPAR